MTEKPFRVTYKAVDKALELIESNENADKDSIGLRVYVQQGGCAGLSYGMKFDRPEEDDTTFRKDGLLCMIDPSSENYIEDSTLDFEDGLQGAGFTFENPNVVSECGCGESFRT